MSSSPLQAPNVQPGTKRPRRMDKCDACRKRKRKCEPDEFGDACDYCTSQGLPCSGRRLHKRSRPVDAPQAGTTANEAPAVDLSHNALSTQPPPTLLGLATQTASSSLSSLQSQTTMDFLLSDLKDDFSSLHGCSETLQYLYHVQDVVHKRLPEPVDTVPVQEEDAGCKQLVERLGAAVTSVSLMFGSASDNISRALRHLDRLTDPSSHEIIARLQEHICHELHRFSEPRPLRGHGSQRVLEHNIATVAPLLNKELWDQIRRYDSAGFESIADQICQQLSVNPHRVLNNQASSQRTQAGYSRRLERMQKVWDKLNLLPELRTAGSQDIAHSALTSSLLIMSGIPWSPETHQLASDSTTICDVLNRTPLHVACEVQDYDFNDGFKDYVNEMVNSRDLFNMTPSHILVLTGGSLHAIEGLQAMGADFSLYDMFGRSPLDLAVQMGHLYIVQHLITKAACNVNTHLLWRPPALSVAAMKGYSEIADLLIRHGADVTFKFQGYTAREDALQRGHRSTQLVLASNEPFDIGVTDLNSDMPQQQQGHVSQHHFPRHARVPPYPVFDATNLDQTNSRAASWSPLPSSTRSPRSQGSTKSQSPYTSSRSHSDTYMGATDALTAEPSTINPLSMHLHPT